MCAPSRRPTSTGLLGGVPVEHPRGCWRSPRGRPAKPAGTTGLERDLWLSELSPARHTAGIFLRDGGACVGVLDWVDEGPNDGLPWVGLVMVHAGHARRAYGRSALRD